MRTVFLPTRKADKSISRMGKINAWHAWRGQSILSKNDFQNVDKIVFEKC